MEPVAIIGAGQTKYGDFPDKGIKELFADAYFEMLATVDKGFDPQLIRAAYIGTLSAGSGFQLGQAGALLMGHVGLPYVPTTRVENACASSSYALHAAVNAVASGKVDFALAAGLEKMRDVSSAKGKYWLGISGDTEFERLGGSTFAGVYAMIAHRFMHELGLKKEHLSMVAVKNHQNAVSNPKAQFRKAITLEQALKGAPVAYPFNIWDCCPTSDGAAAVLVCNAKKARDFTETPIEIIGCGSGCDYLALQDRDSLTTLRAATIAAKEAYDMAGLTPKDIDFAEVHDCFTIAEVLAYGDLGFCEKGQEGRLLEEGYTTRDGKLPVNASGGLKAKGHPLGATGCGQTAEIVSQLRGKAKDPSRQLPKADIGLNHNVGGSGGTACVFIYKRG